MSGLRWYLLKHNNCANNQFHLTIAHQADTDFAEIRECLQDYETYIQYSNCLPSPGTYEIKIFSEEDPYAESQHKDAFTSVSGIDEVETAQNLELLKKQNFTQYIWIVLEKTNCVSDNHFQLAEKSVKTFESVKACLLDFRATSTYDKFNISRNWSLFFEAINADQR